MFKRMVICVFNIIFPPVAVMLLTGVGEDLLFNCLLFLLAIIPSHIHGFYISLTYFNRKGRVRKGVYPGKPRRLIYSEKVNNGGASRREMEILRTEKDEGRLSKRISRRATGNTVQDWDDGSEKYYEATLSRQSSRKSSNRRSRRGEDGFAVDRVPRRQSSRESSNRRSRRGEGGFAVDQVPSTHSGRRMY